MTPRHWHQAEVPTADDVPAWIAGRLPDDWFTAPPETRVDREEILVVGRLPDPEVPGDATAQDRAAAEEGRISRFREETRDDRIRIAREAGQRYRRKLSWGAEAGGTRRLFTTYSAPAMTRLRQPERQVLDTLVAAGVARSRADALAWCVRLVGSHADEWLEGLRGALEQVDRLRTEGPRL
jgi:hypothetical protein